VHSFFTRIFLSFWTVIVLMAASVAAVTAIDFAAAADRPSTVIRAATDALDRDGLDGLRVWLAERNRSRPKQRTLIVGPDGKEILGQRLPLFRFGTRAPGDRPPGLPPDLGPPPGPMQEGSGPFGPMPPPDSERGVFPPERDRPSLQRRWLFAIDMLASGPDGPRWAPSLIRGRNGALYRVIFDPPPMRGPLSPPFSWWVRASLLGVALALSGLVSYLLARSISTPVRRLQAAAHTLSAGNLDARAGPEVTKRRDELGTLGREFDSMAERLSALIAARQRLLRDISHELRSPLARMEMAIGLARQEPATTPEQFDRVQRESERLDQLIGHILEYARLERDPATVKFEDLDVAELTRQIVHDAEFESQSPPGRLRLTSDDAVRMKGDAQVLHSAIDNVVRNALLHGDARLPIKVTVNHDAATDVVRISVRDHGAGVREEDLPHIFEPFYRAGAMDSKHVSTEGTGIGLAITQRAAALHGGEVSARNADGGGLVVTITLPRSSLRTPQSPGG
jgi:signal transduction histidine kinase